MRLDILFSTFATLAVATAVPTAVPIVEEYPAVPMPTPTKPVSPSSAASASPSASPPAPMVPVGPYSCPQNQSKQCCQSLEQTSKDILKPLGDLLPIVNGIQISSSVLFQCRPMRPSEAPDECDEIEYRPMCCSNEGHTDGNSCKPFEKAKEAYYRSFGFGEEDHVDLINDVLS